MIEPLKQGVNSYAEKINELIEVVNYMNEKYRKVVYNASTVKGSDKLAIAVEALENILMHMNQIAGVKTLSHSTVAIIARKALDRLAEGEDK